RKTVFGTLDRTLHRSGKGSRRVGPVRKERGELTRDVARQVTGRKGHLHDAQLRLLKLARTLCPLDFSAERTLIGLWSVKKKRLPIAMAEAPASNASAQSSRLPAPLDAI